MHEGRGRTADEIRLGTITDLGSAERPGLTQEMYDAAVAFAAWCNGDLFVAGRRVNGAPASDLARAGLCLIPEGRGIFPNLTVRENLRMASHRRGTATAIEEAAYRRSPRLADRRRQLAGTMSGGEQQMLALARGLATDPAVLVLDELSMGLAPLVVEELHGQVDAMRLRDPATGLDRLLVRLGVAGLVAGPGFGVAARFISHGTRNPLQQRDAIVVALLGLTVAVVGGALFVKGAVAGFLRFWMARLCYEQQAQADRIAASLAPGNGRDERTVRS